MTRTLWNAIAARIVLVVISALTLTVLAVTVPAEHDPGSQPLGNAFGFSCHQPFELDWYGPTNATDYCR